MYIYSCVYIIDVNKSFYLLRWYICVLVSAVYL